MINLNDQYAGRGAQEDEDEMTPEEEQAFLKDNNIDTSELKAWFKKELNKLKED